MSAPRHLLAALLAIAVITLQGTPASASIGRPDFTSSFRSYLLGDDPRSVAIADLNGDGTLDLICGGRDSVTILLGAGNGIFEAIQKVRAQAPYPSAVGDLDGDGHLDLGIADPAAGQVTVFLGDGTGRLNDGTAYAAGTMPMSALFADLNGDGKLDLVSSNAAGIATRLGTGTGSFGAETDMALPGGTALVRSDDLNGDGIPDLVVGGTEVAILIGNGDGTFHSGVTVPAAVSQFALSDVSGDGLLDLVLPGDSVAVWYGAGDGTFPAHITLRGSGFRGFRSVGVGDINRDGFPDIMAAAPGDDYDAFPPPNQAISIFLGFGQGAFFPETTTPAAGAPTNLAIGDLNGDGSSDLVVTNVAAKVISVHLSRGDGTFGATAEFASAADPYTIEAADFDRDGQLDLATVHYTGTTASVFHGLGAGDFGPASAFSLGSGAVALKPTDMNQDGCPDLAIARTDWGIQTLIGRCDGSLQPGSSAELVGSDPVSIDVADFNGDRLPDVVVAHFGAVSLLLGTGNGSLGAAQVLDADAIGPSLGAVVADDFNRDGNPDVAYVSSSSSISVRLGHGDGSFGLLVVTAVPHTVLAMACGDVNADGTPDIVAVEPRLGNVLLGRGDGTFAAGSEFQLPRDPIEAHLLDLDGDGILDLFTASSFSNLVSVLHGLGDGTFAPAECFGAGVGTVSVVGGDFDGDGRGDLAVANFTSHSVSVLLNRTPGAGPLPARAFLSDPRALVVGAGKAEVCVNVEPVAQAFSRANVGPANPVLHSQGTGSATSINGYLLAPGESADADSNGTSDFPVCFRRGDLARLFDNIRGREPVHATLEGQLLNGRTFRATILLNVASAGGPLHARLSPNPTNPFSVLSFSTTATGWTRVDLFDAAGRLLLTHEERAPAGYHAYVLNDWNRFSGRIASGVYFVRIKTEHDGEQHLRFVMLR